jgi:transposase
LIQRTPKRHEPEKAIACFGAVRQDTGQTYLYFCKEQPTREQTWGFIMALLTVARREHKRVVVLIWDNASWHLSKRLHPWSKDYNFAAKRLHQPRLLIHYLPAKSPWLNPIELRWMHAKRRVCEPNGDLTPQTLIRRLSCHFHTQPLVNVFNS